MFRTKRPKPITVSVLLAVVVCTPAAMLCACASSKPAADRASPDESLRRAMNLAASAQQAHVSGNFTKAIDLNKQSIAINGELGGVWNNLGISLMSRGKDLDFLEASQAFKRAADLLPGDERPYENLGVLYHDRGFDDDALRYFTLALERNPNALRSLRGAVGAAKGLLLSDDAGLERTKRALLIETDPAWREIFEFERLRVQQDLADKGRDSRRSGAAE